MTDFPRKITLAEWDVRYQDLYNSGMRDFCHGGLLSRHADDGDTRLHRILFDNSASALRLWNFLLTEEDRLHEARENGNRIVGTMKDLGTIPVMAYSLPNITAFYPDGAWWTPCVMEMSDRLFEIADSLGVDSSFCPVRAMLGAFQTKAHFPIPDLLMCSVGATCDDFSSIAQRLESLGYPIFWWEAPVRRHPGANEPRVDLPGGFPAAVSQVEFVQTEILRIRDALSEIAGQTLDDDALSLGIQEANRVRQVLRVLREKVFTAPVCPLPALEMQIAEMLAIHFCSDRKESLRVLSDLLTEVETRIENHVGVLDEDAVRVFWVNPVADLRAMNLLEECGGRLCGTEFLFCHALDEIPTDLPPVNALAQMVLADPMVGSAQDRASRILHDALRFRSEAVVISRIPGASHCASEGEIIREVVESQSSLPVIEIEVPPVSDSLEQGLKTRLEALIETASRMRTRK